MPTHICPNTGNEAQLIEVDGLYPEVACSECNWKAISTPSNSQTIFENDHAVVRDSDVGGDTDTSAESPEGPEQNLDTVP